MKIFEKYSLAVTLLLGFFNCSVFTSCVKDNDNEPVPTNLTSTVTDVDNNIYKTVKIGNSWWMAENLKVTKYRNGNSITQAQDLTNWNSSLEAYCLFDNNSTSPGLLYNWGAVNNSNGLAPEGWHVATEQDWKNLEKELGMSEENLDKLNWREEGRCGDKLKIEAPKGWSSYGSLWPDNSSGFTALAGGCRLYNGQWSNPGLFATGFWWSSTENDFNSAWFRQLDYKKSGIFRFYVQKTYGMSIRCVKD